MRTPVLALALVTALAACGDKKADAPPKQAAAPTATPPAATPPPPPTPPAAEPPPSATPGMVGEIKLPLAPRTPGLAWTKTDELTSKMTIGSGAKQLVVDGSRRYVERIEIVELDDKGLVTKVKASYPERADREQINDKPRDKTSPIAGKAYLVWTDGGAIKATHEDGSAVSPEELAELGEDLDELGKPRVMDEIVASRTWKIGETYELTADELGRLNAIKSARAPRTTAMSLALTSVAPTRVDLAMKTTMQLEGKLAMTVHLDGTVALDPKTGQPLSLVLAGPAEGTAGGAPVTGSMSGKVNYEYTPVATPPAPTATP